MNDSYGKKALRRVLAHHASLAGPNLTVPEENPCCILGVEPRKNPTILPSDLFFMLEPVQEQRFAYDYSAVYGEGFCDSYQFRKHYFW